MSEELVIQTNGPYLRVVLPDFDPDWNGVWKAVEFELERGSSAPRLSPPATRMRVASHA